jgi:hypothetical protein
VNYLAVACSWIRYLKLPMLSPPLVIVSSPLLVRIIQNGYADGWLWGPVMEECTSWS